ncbi:hypothetical protein AMELA_G00122130 [Ameiurus melas]|uniref:Uncharacterized protein n=1 Tax=Ameiurus melas TaxID=219545 RepID=A0A7J6AQN9_AMEME|nr:hypothetical protein AMELA_G00122130 [Ameiurus melas]
MCCSIWQQHSSSRFFMSCKLLGVASMDWTCLSSISHRCSIRLRYLESGGQIRPVLNIFCSVVVCIILLKEATSTREYRCHEGVYLVCNNVLVGGTCQSNIYMNAKTQGFPADHCDPVAGSLIVLPLTTFARY